MICSLYFAMALCFQQPHCYETVPQKIERMSIERDVNVDDALRIAECESETGKNLYNLQGSSAKGIYMFIDSTWENYCEGNVLSSRDNIACFLKLYPKYPQWWVCK